METKLKILGLALWAFAVSGCSLAGLDLQKNYDYHHQVLDPHIGISAREFLENRALGTAAQPDDTVFKLMLEGLQYAGIDLSEFEESGRTFIFLENSAIQNVKNKSGIWYNFPIVDKDANGDPIIDANGVVKTHPAAGWQDYPKEDVKNYFLYLIIQGTYNFDQLAITDTAVQTLLPPGTTASQESLLGFLNDGKGFDQQGKMYLKILNNSDLAPIQINDLTNDHSAGYIATNGIIHAFNATVYPFRE